MTHTHEPPPNTAAEQYRGALITALGRYGHDTSRLHNIQTSPLQEARRAGIPEGHITGAMTLINYPCVSSGQPTAEARHSGLQVGIYNDITVWCSTDPFEFGIEAAAQGIVAFLPKARAELPPNQVEPISSAARLEQRPEDITNLMQALYALGIGDIQPEELNQPNYHDSLLRQGRITHQDIARAYQKLTGVELIDPKRNPPHASVRNKISLATIKAFTIVPHSMQDGYLVLLCKDPTDTYGLVKVEEEIDSDKIRVAVASQSEILHLIQTIYMRQEEETQLTTAGGSDEAPQIHRNGPADPNDPVARRIGSALQEAANNDASDVHFQPTENALIIRERLNGNLITRGQLPLKLAAQAINQLKIMAGMSLDSRLPQDRRLNLPITVQGREVILRLRVSSLPSLHGDSMVLRLLKDVSSLPTLDATHFTPSNLQLISDAIAASNGMILVTGPTGSGKTTLMHTILKELNDPSVKIMTIEDPIEYEQPLMVQTATRQSDDPENSLPFARVLRSQLRQDPDVIFVGEIRDEETANVAVSAAQTGHLLLSTLHTNNAAATISRLLDLQVPSYLIAESLRVVVAQRLVGCPCPECSVEEPLPEEFGYKNATMKRGTGLKDGQKCVMCDGTGDYKVMPIHEVLPVNEEVRSAIAQRDIAGVIAAAQNAGLRSLRQDGLEKVVKHQANLNRVLESTK